MLAAVFGPSQVETEELPRPIRRSLDMCFCILARSMYSRNSSSMNVLLGKGKARHARGFLLGN